jgi:hypothetical protein
LPEAGRAETPLEGTMKLASVMMALLIASTVFGADVIAPITKISEGFVDLSDPGSKVIAQWGNEYFSGDWDKLQKDIREALQQYAPVDGSHTFDYKNNYYSVAFSAKRPGAKDPEVVRVLIHCDEDKGACVVPEPYTTRLPGLSTVFEVFVDAAQDAQIARIYTSTPTPDPLQTQLIKASKLIDLPGIAFRNKIAVRSGGPMPSDPLFVRISNVKLRDRRGTIAVTSKITGGAETVADLDKAFADQCSSLALKLDPFSKCMAEVRKTMCTSAANAVKKLQDPIDDAERDAVRAALSEGAKIALSSTECLGGLSPDHDAAVREALATLLEIAAGSSPKTAEGTTTYENTPRTSLSFAALSGAIIRTHGADRAKITDEGMLAADPLPRAITAAALNFHVSPIDPASRRIALAERFGGFVAYVITPEPGLAVGFRSVLFRGLSLNIGYGWLRVDQKRAEDTYGSAPSDTKRPLRSGIAGSPFVGFGYTFE